MSLLGVCSCYQLKAQLQLRALALVCRYKALALGLHIDPAKLGTLTTARGVTQSVLALFAGALGDRFHRGRIIAAGEKLSGAYEQKC